MADPFLGEIRMFSGTFAPLDWAFCNGQILSIAEQPNLFALIGTAYGGDGVTNFALPDLRGRVPMHQGNGHMIGQLGGVETIKLTTGQVPAHTHAVKANTAVGSQSSPAGMVWAAPTTARYTTAAPSLAMKSTLIGNAGSGQPQPHDNMMPFLAVQFIICLNGLWPTRE